jgi:CBS domain containing-hemolysin-like protein
VNSQQLSILIALIILDMLFTAVRASLLNVRFPGLVSMQESGMDVEKTMELVTKRAKTRSTLKLGQALLRFCIAGVIIFYLLMPDSLEIQGAMIVAYMALIGLVLWVFEFVIERLILRDPDTWAVRFTPIANIYIAVFSPLVLLLLKLTRSSESQNLVTISEEELIHLVDASQQAGEIEKDESEMIHSVFEFGDTLVKEIMIPRVDMLALEVSTPLPEAADTLLESGFSRVPVFEDQIDNIVGMIYTKDMLKVWRSGDGIDSLRSLLRPARFIPESKKVDELLDEMQAARIHISMVVDEYGGVAGLVTLEDIIEEIFGEIQDEYDYSEEALWYQSGPGEYIFDGRILIDELNDLMNLSIPTDEADTLGGLIFNRKGRVPKVGDSLQVTGALFTVAEIHERRVNKVLAEIIPLTNFQEESESNTNVPYSQNS